MNVQISCPSCLSVDTWCLGPIAPGISFAGRRLTEPIPGGKLYACGACALWFRWPRLSEGELASLYQKPSEGHWAAPAEKRVEWRMARRWLDEHVSQGRLLDVGCFDGRFLEYMDREWSRFGIEINDKAARQAARRGVDIVGAGLEALREIREPFDAITAIDVIEHVPDPLHVLRQMAGALRTDGAILLATGNTQAPSWQLMGNQYWYCTIPEHLSFIGEEWALRAAEMLGLDVVFVKRYSREADRSWMKQGRQAALSLLLKTAPGLFGILRDLGLSEVEVAGQENLKTYPPIWSTARDHFMVVFRRPASGG